MMLMMLGCCPILKYFNETQKKVHFQPAAPVGFDIFGDFSTEIEASKTQVSLGTGCHGVACFHKKNSC